MLFNETFKDGLCTHTLHDQKWTLVDYAALLVCITVALVLRIAFFTGFFGSDEVAYTYAANAIATGHWIPSNYIGSLRYGINIPVALFIRTLGLSEMTAGLWGLICSIGEVGLVFYFARLLWGLRAGILSSLVLAASPIHMHLAGRLMADPPLAFFMTLSFILFYVANRRQTVLLYVATGVAVGSVFWIKEPVLVFAVLFPIYAVLKRPIKWKLGWAVFAATLMLSLNMCLMWITNDNPFHMLSVMTAQSKKVLATQLRTEAWYYLRYLFLDLRHTWLLGYAGLAAIFAWLRNKTIERTQSSKIEFVLFWTIGLLILFSLMPVSISPPMLIMKQTNYMLIFLAPLSLLAGYWLAKVGKKLRFAALAAILIVGPVLGALQQQAIKAFTANSRSLIDFARQRPGQVFYCGTNGYRAAQFFKLLQDHDNSFPSFRYFSELSNGKMGSSGESNKATVHSKLMAVIDPVTAGWGGDSFTWSYPDNIPLSWQQETELKPIVGGYGRYITSGIIILLKICPPAIRSKGLRAVEPLLNPQPARVYSIPADWR